MLITVSGSGDDLAEVEGCPGEGGFAVFPEPGRVAWRGDLVAPGGAGLRVHLVYEGGGCWAAGAGPVSERVPFPGWPVVVVEAGAVTVDAPEGTRLTAVHLSEQRCE